MSVERPGPGGPLNPRAKVTVPRQAATVIVVRDASGSLEVLLVKRSPDARWMADVWVFPGGAVDPGEAGGGDPAVDDRGHRAAAVRELAEETGIDGVAPEDLVKFSRWITPAQMLTRFDTHFFLAELPAGATPTPDGVEVVDLDWFSPAAALDAYRDGRIKLVFPTIKHLEQLAGFASAESLMRHARRRDVAPVEPRVVLAGEVARVVLPGEPGYDEPPAPPAG